MKEAVVNGVRIAYDTRGDGDPVFYVCGTGMPARTWDLLGGRERLIQNGFESIVFDNRGMPPSECPPAPYTVEEMASDAIGLMEHLGRGPYRLLGASLGGLIAQAVSLRRPDLVRCVVFMVGCGNYSAFARRFHTGLVELLRGGAPWPITFDRAFMLLSAVPGADLKNDEAVEQAISIAEAAFPEWTGPGRHGQFEANRSWAMEDHLGELADLRVPALVVAAEHDVWFPPSLMRQAADCIPHADYYEMRGVAHIGTDPSLGPRLLEYFRKN
jgi:pimeloyl-ACP methyl ester carboxylesterase